MTAKIVYDGEGAVFGRLATLVAKDLLKGNDVDILNCEKIIVSGDKKLFAKRIFDKRAMGQGSSLKGPKFSKAPDRLVKRMVRGMLPWNIAKGRDAHKRLKVFIGGKSENVIKLNHKKPMKYFTIGELAKLLGVKQKMKLEDNK